MDNITLNKSVVLSTSTNSIISSDQTVPASPHMDGDTVNKESCKIEMEFSYNEGSTGSSLTERTVTQSIATTTTQSSDEVNMEPGERLIQQERIRIAQDTILNNGPYTLYLLDVLPVEVHYQIFIKLDGNSLHSLRDSLLIHHIGIKENRLQSLTSLDYTMVESNIAARGGDVNSPDFRQRTLLHDAARGGHYEQVLILIEKGANVNALDQYGESIFHSAAMSGNVNLCKFLIDKGLDVNSRDFRKSTILHYVARNGNVKVCKLLIDNCADVYAKDNDHQSILHDAATRGNIEVLKLLIDNGLDVNAPDRHNQTPLDVARFAFLLPEVRAKVIDLLEKAQQK